MLTLIPVVIAILCLGRRARHNSYTKQQRDTQDEASKCFSKFCVHVLTLPRRLWQRTCHSGFSTRSCVFSTQMVSLYPTSTEKEYVESLQVDSRVDLA